MKQSVAKVHSIQTMGTLDGPGIRYVLFLQGCPFRCLFCHNPDTWDVVSNNLKSVDELVEDVLKYKEFYDSSGGGVTVSGGEPLLQINFLTEFFRRLNKFGIHTAIDTCGHVSIDNNLEKLLKYTDLVLLDIKHLNPDIHKILTGQDNNKVLEFLNYLNGKKKLWIRQVLTPDFTMDDEYTDHLTEFLKKYDIEKVELLPYHDMARGKYEKLGIDYPLKDTKIPTQEEINAIKKKFAESGFEIL